MFIVSDHHQDPNVYYITPLSGKGPVCKVNRQQLFDLKKTQMQSNSDCESVNDDEVPVPPQYIPSHAKHNTAPFHIHPYDTHLRRKVSGSASQPDTRQQVSVVLVTNL